jgi:isopenicillin-N epimerase
VPDLKKYFLLDPNIHFLNHGSFGATPKPVFREYQRWQLELERQPVEFLGRRITKLLADSRRLWEICRYTGRQSYLCTKCDDRFNIIACLLELSSNDEVLATDHEYGAMDRMWRFLSRSADFDISIITSESH